MQQLITLSFIFLVLLLPLNTSAETPDSSWTNVFKFQTKMAASGSVSAQYILGEMYEEGRGVKQSNAKAIEWYTKAQKNGHKEAAARITQIEIKVANKKLEEEADKQKAKSKKQASAKAKAEKKVEPVNKTELTVPKPAPVKIKTKPVVHKELKETAPPVITKPKKRITSPNNLERGKGTHLDVKESENPFE